MVVATGACCPRPAMTLAATPDLLSDSVPDPMPEATPATSASATSATTHDVPAFGWSGYAERVNGRFAMVGFAAVLLIEALSGETFLHWAGLVP
jgi:hypothetical protein